MKEQLYISIPEPCHEDWNQMTPAEKGRHCAVCQKNVIDFTDADDKAIIDFFKNYNGTACGRFTDEQLNRPVSNIEIKPASNFLKYAAGLLLPGLMIGHKVNAQKGQVAIVGDTTAVIPKLKSMPGNNFLKPSCENPVKRIVIGGAVSVSSSKKAIRDVEFITGRVIDADDGTPIVNATISLDSNVNAVTGADGVFIIQKKKKQKELSLFITSVGYQNAELDLSNRKSKGNFIDLSEITLAKQVVGLSEVIITGDSYRRLGGFMGTVSIVSYSISDTVINFFKPQAIKVFPNPVSLNGTLQLNFSKTKPGVYQIRLLNSSGQLFYSFQKQITSPNETEQIHLNNRMSAGMYLLQIMDEKKRLVQTNKVIVK